MPRWPWSTRCLPTTRKGRAARNARPRRKNRPVLFFGLEDRLPILYVVRSDPLTKNGLTDLALDFLSLGALCGFQHSLAMLAGLIAPPIILSSSLALPPETQSYLISASLITSGLLSAIQMSHIPLPVDSILRFISAGRWRTRQRYYIGTGLLTVVGTRYATKKDCRLPRRLLKRVEQFRDTHDGHLDLQLSIRQWHLSEFDWP
jgi:hypothetical protein